MYALVADCTPNNATIVAISSDASELIDLQTDIMRAIRLNDADASVGDRVAVDWGASQVNLADCINGEQAAIENSEAYNTGFEAAAQGEPRTANPYAKGTWDSNAWFAGWDAQ